MPALLSLRNFLAYRENCPPLDFSGIKVACLTGENGNGKSALLDAMTWALWGQARARTDDELIHLGRTEMEVEFEFLVSEQRYRVIRKRKKGTQRSPGATALEFHIATPGGWKALTANHVKETERRIRDVVKIDYETFVNSAFLLQGRADAFTVKTPGERKRILAEILGLSEYDELEQEARYERGLRDDQVRSLERELGEMRDALAHEPSYLEEKVELTEALTTLQADLARESKLLDGLRQAERLLALQREQALIAEKRREEAHGELDRARRSLEQHRQETGRHQLVIVQAEEIERGYERLHIALQDERAFGERLRRQADLARRRAELQLALERARLYLAGQEQVLSASVERLTAAVDASPVLDTKRAALSDRGAVLEGDQERLGRLRLQEQGLREQVGARHSENVALRSEMESIKRKQTELADATVCPLCKTELGEDGQAHIVEAYESEGRKLAAEFREKRAQIQAQEKQASLVQAEVNALDVQLRLGRGEWTREAAVVDAALKEAVDAAARLPDERVALEALRARLSSGEFAPAEIQELRAVEAAMESVGYDAVLHERARKAVQENETFDARHRELGLARARWEGEQAALLSAERLVSEWQVRLEESTAQSAQLRALLTAEAGSADTVGAVQARLEGLQEDQRRHQQALGAVEQKLGDCARLRRLDLSKTSALKVVLDERRIYEELTAAFGRRGIQALIIDNVIPEITEEANRLLARMTNNRLQVMIDTQRQTQKGGVAETLDIRISDDLGTRNYELFSGGEAFRINLALRIALSKLLAHRAGAPLPTLVIDEGFGSQDAAALERLVEAINVIQADFRCLLIITHLSELKDQFPVQIAVTKTADGAIATIVS